MMFVYFCLFYPKYIKVFFSTQQLVSCKKITKESLLLSNLSFSYEVSMSYLDNTQSEYKRCHYGDG